MRVRKAIRKNHLLYEGTLLFEQRYTLTYIDKFMLQENNDQSSTCQGLRAVQMVLCG